MFSLTTAALVTSQLSLPLIMAARDVACPERTEQMFTDGHCVGGVVGVDGLPPQPVSRPATIATTATPLTFHLSTGSGLKPSLFSRATGSGLKPSVFSRLAPWGSGVKKAAVLDLTPRGLKKAVVSDLT